tara:strand:+ start:3084 stop:3338 length:255 start_codon:yes stop_codon:yes gene_type:complete
MKEAFEVGERVRVKIGLQCERDGILHGWATEGRTGTVMWLELNREDGHVYVVGYFLPAVVLEEFPQGFSDQFHNWFAPSEIEEA